MKLTLAAAIEKFNKSSHQKIKLTTTRDGRMEASLPLVGREIIVEDSPFNKDVKVTPSDLAWLCEEARRAFAPGMALLEATLAHLGDVTSKKA
jgi:hypothetical protein